MLPAGLDESDFNGHLSNSSYAKVSCGIIFEDQSPLFTQRKTLDAARFKAALELFPMLFRAGGWIALAGEFSASGIALFDLILYLATHYNFIREIPMLASYEIRMSTASWDQKWVRYLMNGHKPQLICHSVLHRLQICHQTQILEESQTITTNTTGPTLLRFRKQRRLVQGLSAHSSRRNLVDPYTIPRQ